MGEAILNHQSTTQSTLEFWSHDIVTRTPVYGRFPPVFVWLNTATARIVYGRWNAHLGHRRYGNGTRTTRTVHPVYTVRFAALNCRNASPTSSRNGTLSKPKPRHPLPVRFALPCTIPSSSGYLIFSFTFRWLIVCSNNVPVTT